MGARYSLKPVYIGVLLVLSAQPAWANPIGPSVVNGQATFATTGNALTVTNTPGTIINWQGFSIGANEITRFAQQSAASAVLNRVTSNNPSSILGTLQSNGRVFLVNPNGIVFGAGATIDVAGLVATTLNLGNADFLAGRYRFTQVPGAQNISNAGNLTAQQGGQIYLIAPNVRNTGVITAPNGEILLAAGHSVDLVNSTNPNLRVSITAPAGDATNVGRLVASSGSLGLFGTVVRNSGTVSADSATMQGGKIVFKASQRVEAGGTISAQGAGGGTINVLADMQSGTVNVTGTLDASAPNSGNGGFIDTSAAHVQVADTARVTTLAAPGKSGTWLIDPTDFTIAATGGDMTGAAVSAALALGNFTILSTSGATAGNGDIKFDATGGPVVISTSAGTSLNLQAVRDIRFIGGSTTLSGAMNVILTPAGKVATASGSSVTLSGSTVAWLGAAKTWENSGTLTLSGTAQVHLNFNSPPGSASTFHNMSGGIVNVAGTPPGWAFFSNPATQDGIITNDGTFNIIAGTSFEAAYSQSSGGTLNIANGQFLSMQNADVLGGTFNIGTGSSLMLSELHNGARTFSGATINDAGTLSFGPSTVTFSNTTLSYTGGNYTIPTGIIYSGNVGYSATGNLIVSSPINTTGNVTLNADSDGISGGNIQITSSVVSNGGNITLAGGINGAGAAAGTSTASSAVATGVYLSGASVNAGGGNIAMRGTGMAGTSFGADGIYITSNSVVQTSGAGTITLDGTGGAGGVGSSFNSGVRFGTGAQLSSVNGAITLNGQGGAGNNGSNYGVYVHNGATLTSTGSGTITLNGTGASTGTGNAGVRVSASAGATKISTAGGALTLNAIGGASDGLQIVAGALVQSGTGLLTLSGTGGTGAANYYGTWISGANTLVNSGGGMNISGISNSTGTANHGVSIDSGAQAKTTAGAMSITGTSGIGAASDAILLSGAPLGGVVNAAAGLTINGTGYLAVGANATVNAAGYANFSASNITLNLGSTVNVGSGAFTTPGNLNVYGTVSAGAVAVSANTFTLNGGTWNQVSATLPGFAVNDFSLMSGTFIRALGGNGSIATPYLLTDIYGVQGMGSTPASSFALANNVDAAGTVNWNAGAGFSPIGSFAQQFTGQFNGQSHTISNLVINQPLINGAGLFGVVGAAGAVDNVGLLGGSVTGGTSVGGLVGYNYGSISNSYSSGMTVSGREVGGLVGQNSGTITNTYSGGGRVGSLGVIGGLVGDNWNIINNSYSTNVVVAAGYGGLIGWDEMGYINNSYWDIQASGSTFSSGKEIGLTTAQMKTMSSFAGWSIANTGGSGAVWRIYEGQTYPLLTSFLTPLTVTANAVTKAYDGLAYSGGNGVTYSVASPVLYGMLAYTGTSQGAINTGSYAIAASGLYSNQQGYDLRYVNGTLTISTAPAPAPAPTTTSFLPDLVNTMLIPGGGASGSSQSTIINNRPPVPLLVLNGEIPPVDGDAQPMPVCR